MDIRTTKFGILITDEDKILHFPEGIPGFPRLKDFILLTPEETAPFCHLQSVEDPDISFVVLNPLDFCPAYAPEFSEETLDLLQISEHTDTLLLCMVVIPEDPKKMTINLAAPILINAENRLAKQEILSTGDFSLRHRIFTEEGELAHAGAQPQKR